MSGEACTCPHIDGFRIRSGLCARHNECLDRVGPVPKLDGQTFVCTKPRGHDMPHESPDGTWWEPPDKPRCAATDHPRRPQRGPS